MTIFLGWNFSMGILLYWFTNSAMIIQQLLGLDQENRLNFCVKIGL